MGGFGKEPEDYPDPYHSYLALAALALSHSGEYGMVLKPLDAQWNLSSDTAEWLRREMTRVKEDDECPAYHRKHEDETARVTT